MFKVQLTLKSHLLIVLFLCSFTSWATPATPVTPTIPATPVTPTPTIPATPTLTPTTSKLPLNQKQTQLSPQVQETAPVLKMETLPLNPNTQSNQGTSSEEGLAPATQENQKSTSDSEIRAEDQKPQDSKETKDLLKKKEEKEKEEKQKEEKKKEKEKEEKQKEEKKKEETAKQVMQKIPLQQFGRNFFESARRRILEMERKIVRGEIQAPDQRNAISGFVGPLEMISSSVYATTPHQYVLSPGDMINLIYSGNKTGFNEVKLLVDKKGLVTIPDVGQLMVAGMTLDQFQENVNSLFVRSIDKHIKLSATLEELKSIPILITGEAFRSGSYAISSVTTLFNALHAAGGPSDIGSLRDIRLLRNDQTIRVDFYDYLLHGNNQSDLPLQSGDQIFIPLMQKSVAIDGEVVRPAIYELKEGEKLKHLIELAGGIKPSGLYEKVQIQSVIPNQKRIIIDVDLTKEQSLSATPLYDGDKITVFPILPNIDNTVMLEGAVIRPGMSEYKTDMRVSDLFSKINTPLADAFMEKADIVRFNEDGRTTRLISVHLGKALSGDPEHNIRLAVKDKVVVYSKWDVKFIPAQTIRIEGNVQKPGDYERSLDMKVKDLLNYAGNILPDTYLERADLLRYDFEKQITTLLPINLKAVLEDDKSANLVLQDRDLLRVYSNKEVQYIPAHLVKIEGNVQKPGDYERSLDMKVKDLLNYAGNILPDTYLERADLLRYDFEKQITTLLPINLKAVLEDDKSANLVLQDRDLLRVYSNKEVQYIPAHLVKIEGNVQKPGDYERSLDMKVKDLLNYAGNILPDTYLERADLLRYDFEKQITTLLPINLKAVLEDDKSANLVLQDRDSLQIYSNKEVQYIPAHFVSIFGAVQRPERYPRSKGMRLKELLFVAGGTLPDFYEQLELVRARTDGKTTILEIDINKVMEGDSTHNVLLEDDDIVMVRSKQSFFNEPILVEITGEVQYPGTYALRTKHDRLSDLMKRAGEVTKNGYLKGAVFLRKSELIPSEEIRKDLESVNSLFNRINLMEYQRQVARSNYLSRKENRVEENSTVSQSVAPVVSDSASKETVIKTLTAPQIAQTAGQTTEKAFGIFEEGSFTTSPARELDEKELQPSERVIIDLPGALSSPGEASDLKLRAGDRIKIPRTPNTVNVTGAVIRPTIITHNAKLKLDDYINKSGQMTPDAAIDKIIVFRMDGSIVPVAEIDSIEIGDMIYVPSKPLTLEVVSLSDKILDTVKFVVVTVVSYNVLLAILAL
ncbi:SLBB domain-containing protein [Deltaproteobacteria bacterium TL4]